MPMTVVITNNVADRFRGFLASCMLEAAPGVYTHPTLSKRVRDRIWGVLTDWYDTLGEGALVMLWADGTLPGKQGVLTLGAPSRSIIEYDGVYLSRLERHSDEHN